MLSLFFLGINLKWKLGLLFIFHHQSNIWQTGKILVLELLAKILSANQIAGFFKILCLKKEMNDEVLFWHTEKHQSLLQLDTIIFGVCNQACPKYPK